MQWSENVYYFCCCLYWCWMVTVEHLFYPPKCPFPIYRTVIAFYIRRKREKWENENENEIKCMDIYGYWRWPFWYVRSFHHLPLAKKAPMCFSKYLFIVEQAVYQGLIWTHHFKMMAGRAEREREIENDEDIWNVTGLVMVLCVSMYILLLFFFSCIMVRLIYSASTVKR